MQPIARHASVSCLWHAANRQAFFCLRLFFEQRLPATQAGSFSYQCWLSSVGMRRPRHTTQLTDCSVSVSVCMHQHLRALLWCLPRGWLLVSLLLCSVPPPCSAIPCFVLLPTRLPAHLPPLRALICEEYVAHIHSFPCPGKACVFIGASQCGSHHVSKMSTAQGEQRA